MFSQDIALSEKDSLKNVIATEADHSKILNAIISYLEYYGHGNDLDYSSKIFDEGLHIALSLKDTIKLTFLYRSRAYDLRKSNFSQSNTLFLKSLNLSIAINDSLNICKAYNGLTNLHLLNYKPKQAFKYANNALKYALGLKDTLEIINARRGIATGYRLEGKFKEALEEIDESLKLCKDKEDCLNSLGEKAFYLTKTGKRVEALKIYLKLKDIFQEREDEFGVASANHHIGYLLDNTKLYEQGLAYYLKALTYYERIEFKSYLAAAHGNIGDLLLKLNKPDDAEHHFDKSFNYMSETGNGDMAAHYLSMAELFMLNKKFPVAKKNIQKALQIYTNDSEMERGISDAKLCFAKLYLATKRIDSSEYYVKDALAFYEDNNLEQELESGYYLLSKIYKERKDIKSAALFRHKKDSISSVLYGPENVYNITKELMLNALNNEVVNDNPSNSVSTNTNIESEPNTNSYLLPILIAVLFSIPVILFIFKVFNTNYIVNPVNGNNHEYPYKASAMSAGTDLKEQVLREKKNARIELGEEEAQFLIPKLNKLMIEDKVYLNANLSLSDLANLLNTSNKKLSILLNEYLDSSFYDYLNKYRIEDTKKMLLDENCPLSIDGIAEECGFKTRSSFYKLFKKFVGLTPSQFKSRSYS